MRAWAAPARTFIGTSGGDRVARVEVTVEHLADRYLPASVPLLAPFGLLVVLVLRSLGYARPVPLWSYLVGFGTAWAFALVVRPWSRRHPSPARMQVEIAGNAVLTAVVYLTGWGPELVVANVLVGVMNILCYGNRAWWPTVFWNGLTVAVAQVGVVTGTLPTILPPDDSVVLAGLGLVAFGMATGLVGLVVARSEHVAGRERIVADLLARSEERFRSLVQHSSDAIMLVAGDGRSTAYASPAALRLLETGRLDLDARGPLAFVHPDDVDRLTRRLRTLRPGADPVRAEVRVVTATGRVRTVDGVFSDLTGNPAVAGYVVNLHDVTGRKALEHRLAHEARHDPLTGLPNRRQLVEEIDAALLHLAEADEPPEVLFVDLDRFKEVNDRLGHSAGDEVLLQLGRRMQAAADPADVVGRLGGDEFVVVHRRVEGATPLAILTDRLRACVGEPFTVAGRQVDIGMSVGVTVATPAMSAAAVLDRADRAMYVAKEGRDGPLP